jgi:endonuclease III
MSVSLSLPKIVARLANFYGKPKPPITTDPFELIVWENVAYLVSDDRRAQAFELLRKTVGTKPHEILAAPTEALLKVAQLGGVQPERRAARLRELALIAMDEFGGDVSSALRLPLLKAKKVLQKFPGIGEPSAEKILLLTRSCPVLGLESNGLRVLLRLGFGEEKKNYSASYRSVQDAIKDQFGSDYDRLIDAHSLLRQHGKETCKTNRPMCEQCRLKHRCRFIKMAGSAA